MSKSVKTENEKLTFKILHKRVRFVVSFPNQTSNVWNLVSGFFPEFPDPVFCQKKNCEDLRWVKLFSILSVMSSNIMK